MNVFDSSYNPASTYVNVYIEGSDNIIARGMTNSSGVVMFWLPMYNIDSTTSRMKYKVVIPAGIYPNDMVFNNVTVPQTVKLGGASSAEMAKRSLPDFMKTGKPYTSDITFTPDKAMSNLRFVQTLPDNFDLQSALLEHGNTSGTFSCSLNSLSGRNLLVNSTNCALLNPAAVFGAGSWFRLTYTFDTPSATQLPGSPYTYNLTDGGVYVDTQ